MVTTLSMKAAVADSGEESVKVVSEIVKYGHLRLVLRLNGLVDVQADTNKPV